MERDTGIGGRVAEARGAKGLSQERLAERLGVRLATVRAWEAGKSAPRGNRLHVLAGLLTVSMRWLLTGEHPEGAAPLEAASPSGAESQTPDVRALRAALRLSQSGFAARFGLSLDTVQNWEQRRRMPDRSARILLRMIEAAPDLVGEVVAAEAEATGTLSSAAEREMAEV